MDISTPMLTDSFRGNLVSVIKHHKGNLPLMINYFDPETGYRVPFYSRKNQVAANSELIRALREMGIEHIDIQKKK